MLASDTQEIADYFKKVMTEKFGNDQLSNHFADTRDTLCYATNDNQSATFELLKQKDADIAVVVGGYNSSNTTHLVELLEKQFNTFFIKNEKEIYDKQSINSFDIHKEEIIEQKEFLPEKDDVKIIITSGASCPDSVVDRVIQRIIELYDIPFSPEDLK